MGAFPRNTLVVVIGCALILRSATLAKVLKRHTYYNTTEYEVFLLGDNILEIELEAFKNVELYTLYIQGNPLEKIRKGVFVNVWTNEMYIFGNNISTIEPGSFQDIHSWEENGIFRLSLSYNKLEAITKGIFNKTKFRSLLLNSNKIKYIEPGSFEGMPHLLEIELAGNLLERIDTGVFQALVAPSFWIRLIFQSNKITFVDPYAFENTTLYTLDLRENKLVTLSPKYFKRTSIGTFLV